MKYYTYLHYRNDTGEVFYVGKGTKLRAYRTYHKDNPAWHDIVAKHGYKVEIVEYFNTRDEALIAETRLMELHADTIVNKQLRSIGDRLYPENKYLKQPINTKIYTQLGDIWVNLSIYYSRLKENKTTGCLEVVRGPRHNQGYMMIGAIRESDQKRIMTTGARVAARLKLGREMSSSECVIKTCGNVLCHNPDHLLIGTMADMHEVKKKNNRNNIRTRAGTKMRRQYTLDVADMYWIINHTVQECVERFGWSPEKVRGKRCRIRKTTWLHHFDTNGKLKPEFDHLYVDKL